MTRPGKQEVPVKRQFECEKNVLIRFSGHPKPDLEGKKNVCGRKRGYKFTQMAIVRTFGFSKLKESFER